MTADLLLDGAPWACATEPDPVDCRSRLLGHPLAAPGAALVCGLDHGETGEALHAAGPVRWSDADAAESLRRHEAAHPTCQHCRGPLPSMPWRGCCSARCAYLEHDARDEHEIAGEAA